MRLLRKTAVVTQRNMLGRKVRGRLPLEYVRGMDRDELLNHLDAGWMLPMLGGAPANQNQTDQGAIYFPRAIVVSVDQTILQNDMVYWDPINYTLKQLTQPGQVPLNSVGGYGASSGFCGVAGGTNVPGVYPNPQAGTPSENLGGVVVQRGGTVRLGSPAGDGTYFPFEPVTVGADQQTVSRGAETAANRVGYIIVSPPTLARSGPGATPLPETVAAGGQVVVWIEPKFPGTYLL